MQKALAIKVCTIVVVALILMIPITMVKSQLDERRQYNLEAVEFVKSSWTAEQRIITPELVMVYSITDPVLQSGQIATNVTHARHVQTLIAEELTGQVTVVNTLLQKSIYEIPVYQAHITLAGYLSSEQIQHTLDEIKLKPGYSQLEEAYLHFQISDSRGIQTPPVLKINDRKMELFSHSYRSQLGDSLGANLKPEQLKEKLNFSLQLSIPGMEQLSFVPLADSARIDIKSDWPHPQFVGFTLPAGRNISAKGFDAYWTSTNLSGRFNTLIRTCPARSEQCTSVQDKAVGVRFIEPVNVYVKSERAIKYAMLFIGLSFIVFFLFEVIKSTRIHPIQYAFVGLAIAIFYLLLLSLSEHVDFALAYGISVLACCGLLQVYLRHVLRSGLTALVFSLSLAGLYGVLYVILQAEDYAQLMGSVLVFAVLATLMLVTRKLDWYEVADFKAVAGK